MSDLILPGTLEFSIALAEIPPVPTWRREFEQANGEGYLICRPGSMGLMEAVDRRTFLEYCNDGELDERQLEIDEHEDDLEGVIF